MELERQNLHWNSDFSYAYPIKRFIFDKIWNSSQNGLITAIYGLRRVGKSTLLKQVINQAIEQKTRREDVLYFSFDESTEDFWEVIKAYEKQIGRKVSSENYVCLDEVQKVPNWKEKVKLLYDSCSPKILISGSNSSNLRKGTESLAGRVNEFILSEISFKEFLHLKENNSLYYSNLNEALEQEFWNYVKRPFPELAVKPILEPKQYTESIAKKVIFEDLPQVFPIDAPNLLFTIFTFICKNPGMLLDYSSLSSDLSRDRKTISNYVTYLKFGFLIRQIFNYSPNQLSTEKKLKKAYPSLACFVDAQEPLIVETIAAQILKARFFWNFKNRYEVDFVNPSPLVGFEVKFRNVITKEDLAGLTAFNSKYPSAKTVLISKKNSTHVPYYKLERFLEENKLQKEATLNELL